MVEILGHRGARGHAPESTITGLERALALGAAGVEIDTVMTADKVLVMHHDRRLTPAIARSPDGTWVDPPGAKIIDLTFEELQAFDVGRLDPQSDYGREYPDQLPQDGARIPSLRQVLAWACEADARDIELYVELKINPDEVELSPSPIDFADAHVALVREFALADRVVLQSFDWNVLARIRDMAPELAIACITAEGDWVNNIRGGGNAKRPWTAGLDINAFAGSTARMVQAFGAPTWSSYYRNLDADNIAEAHALALKVTAWTVNDEGEMARLIAQGVDAIITDYPDRLRRVAAP